MLPLLAIVFSVASGPNVVQGTTNDRPVYMAATQTPRTTSASSTNITVVKDRVWSTYTGASTVTDYQVTCSDSAQFSSSNPSIPIANNGMLTYSNSGFAHILSQTPNRGTYAVPITTSSVVGSTSSNVTALTSGSLASNLNYSVQQLLIGKTSGQWGYNPNAAGSLMTNQGTWVWPVPLPITKNGPQATLIAPNALLSVNHWQIPAGQNITLIDTNGVVYTPTVASVTTGFHDMLIAILNSNMPASMPPISILPPTWTNKMTDLSGVQVIWAHNNNSKLDLGYCLAYPQTNIYSGGNGVQCILATTNIFGADVNSDGSYGATTGDSGSPIIAMLGTTPIMFGATTMPGQFTADFVSDYGAFNFITNTLGGSATLSIVNISGYPSY